MTTPLATVQAFLDAVDDEDETLAAASCTPDGWHDENTDSPRRYFKQAQRKSLVGVPVEGARILGSRAAQRVVVGAGPRPRPLWFLLHNDGGWRLDGVVRSDTIAAMFLQELCGARLSVYDLPKSLAAESWAIEAVKRHRSGVITSVDDLTAAGATVLGASVTGAPGRLADLAELPDDDAVWLSTGDVVRAIEEAARPRVLLVVPGHADADANGFSVRLAATFAGTGVRTLLADLDFRHQALDQRLPTASVTAGLGGVLDKRVALDKATSPTDVKGLTYLRAGRVQGQPEGDPAQLILAALQGEGSELVVTTGGSLEGNKALGALAALPEVGVVVVLPAGRVTADELGELTAKLGENVVGVVLSEVSERTLPDFDEETFAAVASRIQGHETSVAVAGSCALPAVNRAVAGLRYADGRELWTLFETSADGSLREIGHGAMASLTLLLDGIELRPDTVEGVVIDGGGAPAADGKPAAAPPLDAEGQDVVETLLSGVIAAAEAAKGDNPTASQAAKQVPAAFASFFQQTLKKANAEFERSPDLGAKVVDLEEARQRLRSGEGDADPINDSLKKALGSFMEAHSGGSDEVDVSPEFLQEHGAELVGNLLGAVFKEIVPPDIGLEVPKKDADGKVKVNIDMGKLLGGLLGQITKAAAEAAPKKPDGPPSSDDS